MANILDIQNNIDYVFDSVNGISLVLLDNEKYVYVIDETGELLNNGQQYIKAKSFDELGYAEVHFDNGETRINTKGEDVLEDSPYHAIEEYLIEYSKGVFIKFFKCKKFDEYFDYDKRMEGHIDNHTLHTVGTDIRYEGLKNYNDESDYVRLLDDNGRILSRFINNIISYKNGFFLAIDRNMRYYYIDILGNNFPKNKTFYYAEDFRKDYALIEVECGILAKLYRDGNIMYE